MKTTEEAERNIEDFIGEDPPFGVMLKTPRLELPVFYSYGDSYREKLTEEMEAYMFYTYFLEHFCDPESGAQLRSKEIPQKRVLAGEALRQAFPSYEPIEEKPGYVFESYGNPFPQLVQREATYAIIFPDGSRVAYAVDNTYKYQEWDELFDTMIGSNREVCNRLGLNRAFVIYTDSSDSLPVWTLYEKTVAGFAVDRVRKKLTAFPPRSAVLIFHSLFQLCSAQYGSLIGVSARTGPAHTNLDPPEASGGSGPYVSAFLERLEQYQERYDERALLEAYEDGPLLHS